VCYVVSEKKTFSVSSRKQTAVMERGTAATFQKLSQLCDAVIVRIAVMTPQENTVVTAI
jgi:hypothetical protein